MSMRDSRYATPDDLARLTLLAPDRARAEAVRLRCHSELARRASRAERTDAIVGLLTRVCVPALLGAFAAVYAAALFSATIRVEHWVR